MSASSRPPTKKAGHKPSEGQGRIAARSRNMTILLFVILAGVMAIAMAVAFSTVIKQLSYEYSENYAVGSAETLSAHFDRELGLISKAAHSDAVTEWLADEHNEAKKALAYDELNGIIGELYSFNLYVVAESSLNEYQLETIHSENAAAPFVTLDEANPEDAWYFTCRNSENKYLLSVDIDHVLQRKRVWLDYKVVRDGVILGVISTGLEFSHVTRELFSHNANNMRGLLIDDNGMIQMDSALMGDKTFLYHDFESPVSSEFSDLAMLAAIEPYLNRPDVYTDDTAIPASIKLSSGLYRHIIIVPVKFTNWITVILADHAPLFDLSLFIPVSITVLVVLILFVLVNSAVNHRLIFRPLNQLNHSLERIGENNGERIYGIERNDELGHLSQTIQDLFDKANIDALTGIYNRRFMENSFEQITKFLSRSGSLLSVLMLDIDYFKKYNDLYGHDQGDVCLKAVAQSLSGAVKRLGDFTARYGGEEFIVVLPNTDEAGARLIADKLLENVRALHIPHERSDAAPCVTVSIGVTTGTIAHGQSWKDYMRRADEALYASKQSGRNKYTYLGPVQ